MLEERGRRRGEAAARRREEAPATLLVLAAVRGWSADPAVVTLLVLAARDRSVWNLLRRSAATPTWLPPPPPAPRRGLSARAALRPRNGLDPRTAEAWAAGRLLRRGLGARAATTGAVRLAADPEAGVRGRRRGEAPERGGAMDEADTLRGATAAVEPTSPVCGLGARRAPVALAARGLVTSAVLVERYLAMRAAYDSSAAAAAAAAAGGGAFSGVGTTGSLGLFRGRVRGGGERPAARGCADWAASVAGLRRNTRGDSEREGRSRARGLSLRSWGRAEAPAGGAAPGAAARSSTRPVLAAAGAAAEECVGTLPLALASVSPGAWGAPALGVSAFASGAFIRLARMAAVVAASRDVSTGAATATGASFGGASVGGGGWGSLAPKKSWARAPEADKRSSGWRARQASSKPSRDASLGSGNIS